MAVKRGKKKKRSGTLLRYTGDVPSMLCIALGVGYCTGSRLLPPLTRTAQ